MKINNLASIRKKVLFGELSYNISSEEAAILKLIAGEKSELLANWANLWEHVSDYEDLPFSCKELMPSAISRLQANLHDSQWTLNIPGYADFLGGLPRYTWTKNQFILNKYRVLASALEKEKIEFLVLKGVCEMLDGNDLSLMRTSRDIDLLVQEKDWYACEQVISKLGWELQELPLKYRLIQNPIKLHAKNFQNRDRIFDLDVHFTVIPGSRLKSEKFTQSLWQRKVAAKNFPGLYIPCISDRLIISVANAIGLDNWFNGHATKYFFDILIISQRMNKDQIAKAIEDAEFDLHIGEQIQSALDFVDGMRNNLSDLRNPMPEYAFTKIVNKSLIRNIFRFQMLIELGKMMFNSSRFVYVLSFLVYKISYKIFISLPFKFLAYFKLKSRFKKTPTWGNPQFAIHLFPRSGNS